MYLVRGRHPFVWDGVHIAAADTALRGGDIDVSLFPLVGGPPDHAAVGLLLCIYVKGSQNCSTDGVQE
jgi:hypothetical protein